VSVARSAWRLAAALACLMAGVAATAAAQKAEWTDVVYVPGYWAGGRLIEPAAHQATDSLAMVMSVEYFSAPPKWRAEIRRTTDGATMGAAQILIGEGERAVVLTPLGATPLEQHALGRDPMVRALVIFDATGHRRGAARGRIVERTASGTVGRVVYRRPVRNPQFDPAILNPGGRSATATLLSSGVARVGDQRSASVVATAGARGVDNIKTPNGQVPVTPDTSAVARMDHYSVGTVALEEFLRAGGLGPYAAPGDSTGRQP
jgi:hypothetical protein